MSTTSLFLFYQYVLYNLLEKICYISYAYIIYAVGIKSQTHKAVVQRVESE